MRGRVVCLLGLSCQVLYHDRREAVKSNDYPSITISGVLAPIHRGQANGLPGARGEVLGALRGSIRSYALEAERKMGQMLKETDRAKGAPGPGRGKPRTKLVQGFTDALPLADLGLTRKESSRAQMLASGTGGT